MNLNKIFLAFLIFISTAVADVVSYTNTLPANFDYTENTIGRINTQQTITIPQWDNNLFVNSTLVSVSYQIRGFYSFNYFVSTGPNTYGDFEFAYNNMYMQVEGPFTTSTSVNLIESDFGGQYSTNFVNVFPLTTISGTSGLINSVASDVLFDNNIANYIGTGTLSFLINESSFIYIKGYATGNGDISYTQGASKYNALELVVNYEYITIPESNSLYVLLGITAILIPVYYFNNIKRKL
jgi:hypothetical protein